MKKLLSRCICDWYETAGVMIEIEDEGKSIQNALIYIEKSITLKVKTWAKDQNYKPRASK